jgi:hypothetical protein
MAGWFSNGRGLRAATCCVTVDWALFRNFAISGRLRLDRLHAYNLTNTTQFAKPNASLGEWDVQDCNPATSNQTCVNVQGVSKQLIANYSTSFGYATSTQPNSVRTVEVGLRLSF